MTESLALRVKLTAARLVCPVRRSDPLEHLAWVESGDPFAQSGIHAFLDGIPPALPRARAEEVARLLDEIETERPEPDRLAGLYMRQASRHERHAGGEYYTPPWLVDHVLQRAGFTGRTDDTLLDPMCGAGAFLAAAVSRLRSGRPRSSPADLTARVAGMEINPLAALLARVAYLRALIDLVGREPIEIPVRVTDAILNAPSGALFDVVAGNPPWVSWESLSPDYRARTKHLWKRQGLFPDGGGASGMQVMLGRGRKDLSMLATYTAAENFLGPGGRLVFVITQSVFKSVGAGAGFRRFVLGDGTPLRVSSVDDFSRRRVFPGATTRTAVLALIKGEATRYPVAYSTWRRGEAPLQAGWAEPVDGADGTSAWLTGPRERIDALRRVLGPSSYRARAGAYTGGANGVYWVRRLEQDPELVHNLAEAGKRAVPHVTARLESEILYPLLRASEVGRFSAEPADWILMPQDPVRRRGLDEETMAERYPLALDYLRRFKEILAQRRDRGTRSLIDHGAPFYSIFSVSRETLSPWKVVWPRIASRLAAAVVGPLGARPVIPQETCTFIDCGSAEEAAFLAGLLNSSLVNEAACAFAQTGGKSFGSPHLLRHIAVPRYDPLIGTHRRLAALVLEGGPALPVSELDDTASSLWAGRPDSP